MTISSLSLSKVVIMLILASFNLNVSMIDGQVAPQPIAVDVTINNKLLDSDLKFHCKDQHSAQVDLGDQTVSTGRSWSFKFLASPFYVPLYSCTFSWHGAPDRHFDIYEGERDGKACNQDCTWDIYEINPCRVSGTDQQCFPWKEG
ncbi:S-protein homolog 5-like [Arachis duranensis]|uniref:S-protein homolog n=1 Tax=Arachis duranensis TaxID=130453 RepID=A0A6P4DKS9_ARADU|nr:S-protein homolog 5-like [Arachis duranensis]